MLLAGLRAWLGPVDGIELTATAATVDEYLDAGPDPADVVLLDLNLRDGSTPAADVARLLHIGAAVLVVSTIPDAEHVLATIEAGAAGYVTKDNAPNWPSSSARTAGLSVPGCRLRRA